MWLTAQEAKFARRVMAREGQQTGPCRAAPAVDPSEREQLALLKRIRRRWAELTLPLDGPEVQRGCLADET